MAAKLDSTTQSPRNMRETVQAIYDLSGKADHILIGPVKVYSEDDVSFFVAAGPPGYLGEIKLGVLHQEPDPAVMAAFDHVLVMRRGDSITLEEGQQQRDDFADACTRAFSQIEVFDTEPDFGRAYARRFPSEKSRSLCQQILDEYADREN